MGRDRAVCATSPWAVFRFSDARTPDLKRADPGVTEDGCALGLQAPGHAGVGSVLDGASRAPGVDDIVTTVSPRADPGRSPQRARLIRERKKIIFLACCQVVRRARTTRPQPGPWT